MSEKEILEKLKQALYSYSSKETEKVAQETLEKGIDPMNAINALTEAVRQIGERYGRMELFLGQLIKAGDAMKAGMNVLVPNIPLDKKPKPRKVVIGTVKGDIHSIGKKMVCAMIMAEGFEIYDIGEDVPTKKFIEMAEEVGADIIATSALLTSTMPYQKELIEFLKAKGLRDKYKIMVGGSPTSKAWAEEIGADAWAIDAVKAAKEAKRILE